MIAQERLTRQLDLIPIECLGERIAIIGAGAVGSWTALALAKMGFGNIEIWDDDVVDVENMNCSLYRVSDVDTLKVDALCDIVEDFTEIRMGAHNERWIAGKPLSGIVIMAVDSMEVRRAIWENHVGRAVATRFIIDPRMGAETALLYVMNPMDLKDAESYAKTLYADEAAVREPCTRKATAYCALGLSGLIAAQVKSIVTKQPYSRITQWDLPGGSLQAWRKTND